MCVCEGVTREREGVKDRKEKGVGARVGESRVKRDEVRRTK